MRTLPAGLALAALALLVGCTPADPVVTAAPTPSATPLFATDAEALKAATDAYAAYLKVSDAVSADGGKDPERLRPLVTPKDLKHEIRVANQYQKDFHRTSGSTSFDSVRLQQYADGGPSDFVLVVYLCLDFSAIELLDSKGNDITPPSLPDRVSMEVSYSRATTGSIVLSRNSPWAGKSFC